MKPSFREELRWVGRSLRGQARLERSFGVEHTEGASPKKERRDAAGSREISEGEVLEKLCRTVAACVRCPLHRGRTQTVFGEGSHRAELMFVGEAPGMEEDRQGRPFVGQAGKLLTKIIEAIGLRRDDVYIANVIKCRPPGNRSPQPEEICACTPYLEEQIRRVRPRLLCALGKHATTVLVRKEEPISSLRGSFYDYQGIPVMPTYHPAYLLRNPSAKRLVWEDMKKVRAALKRGEAAS